MKLTILSALLISITSTIATSQPEISIAHFVDMIIREFVLDVVEESINAQNMRIAKVIAAICEEERIQMMLEELSLYYEKNQANIVSLDSPMEGMLDE